MALSAQLRLILVPLDHVAFGCFEEPAVPPALFFCCNDPHGGLYQRGMFRRPLGGSKHLEVFNKASMPKSLAALPVSGPPHRPSSRTSPGWVIAPCFAVPRPPQRRACVYGRSLRCSRILPSSGPSRRKGRVVVTSSALEANDPQEDIVAHRSEPGEVLRTESPHHTCVQQGLNHLGLQHAGFQTTRAHLYIV